MEFKEWTSAFSGLNHLTASYDWSMAKMRHMEELVMHEIAKSLADQFIERHGQEILAALDPVAIANMSIAEAGAAVNETLKKKLPDKILEIQSRGRDRVFQKGLFGGLREI